VELTARGLVDGFSRDKPSLASTVELPSWDNGNKTAWPPPKPSLAAVYSMSMGPQHDPHYSADWAGAREKDIAKSAATEAQWAEEEKARQAQSKRRYDESLLQTDRPNSQNSG
jgi:hypothetical protein